jgi:hypothetical protein
MKKIQPLALHAKSSEEPKDCGQEAGKDQSGYESQEKITIEALPFHFPYAGKSSLSSAHVAGL